MLASLFVTVSLVQASGDIIIDGNPNDWVALGLSPIGTDPPYNTETYHHISSDLLEAWACRDEVNLYLMIKVRGGYSFDWDRVDYSVWINIDPEADTGAIGKWDYAVSDGHYNLGSLFAWNETILTWSYRSGLQAHAGSLGHIEWKVPLNIIGNVTDFEFRYYTWDSYLHETVNEIRCTATLNIVPEFSSFLFLLAFMTTTLMALVFYRKAHITSGVNPRHDCPLKRRLCHFAAQRTL